MTIKPKESVLVIPDTHAPFQHPDAYNFLEALADKYQPTKIVHLGDEADFHAISRFPSDPDGMSAGDEYEAMLEQMEPLYDMFPDVQVCISNHTARPFRKAYDAGMPAALLKSYREFMQAPEGWSWHESIEIDGVKYEHGEGFTGAYAATKIATANMQSTVHGHVHSSAGIHWIANPKHLIFGFNVGCLIDTNAYAFAYGKRIKNKPILGAGIVYKGLPTFVPMMLDARGKWTKKL